MSDVISSLVEVKLKNDEDFLKVKETLSRIGIASHKNKTLYQTCHILHKKGKYYIVHFLEMFLLDGKGKNFSEEDRGRRNTIANLLEEWGLVTINNHSMTEFPVSSMKTIRVIPFKEKGEWTFVEKYSIGKKGN
jgi:hypothetical protein